MSPAGRPRNNSAGFTYVAVLIAMAVLSVLASIATTQTSRVMASDRETELLFRGEAYRNAIRSYYLAGPGARFYPRALADLLKDPRFPNRRHLRALYSDPMTSEGLDWNLIRAADGGIAGVASRSKSKPLKQMGFPEKFRHFENAGSYTDWLFEYQPTLPQLTIENVR